MSCRRSTGQQDRHWANSSMAGVMTGWRKSEGGKTMVHRRRRRRELGGGQEGSAEIEREAEYGEGDGGGGGVGGAGC